MRQTISKSNKKNKWFNIKTIYYKVYNRQNHKKKQKCFIFTLTKLKNRITRNPKIVVSSHDVFFTNLTEKELLHYS